MSRLNSVARKMHYQSCMQTMLDHIYCCAQALLYGDDNDGPAKCARIGRVLEETLFEIETLVSERDMIYDEDDSADAKCGRNCGE